MTSSQSTTLRFRLLNMFDRGYNACHKNPKNAKQLYIFDPQVGLKFKSKTDPLDHRMHGIYFESLVNNSNKLEDFLVIMHAKYMALKYVGEYIVCAFYYSFVNNGKKADDCKLLAYYFAWFAQLSSGKILTRITFLMNSKNSNFLKNFTDAIVAYQLYEKLILTEKLPLLESENIKSMVSSEQQVLKPKDPKGKQIHVEGESQYISIPPDPKQIQTPKEYYQTVQELITGGEVQNQVEKIRRFNLISSERPGTSDSDEYEINLLIHDKLNKVIQCIKEVDPKTKRNNVDEGGEDKMFRSNIIEIMRQTELQKRILRKTANRNTTEALIAANRNSSLTIVTEKEDYIFTLAYYRKLQKYVEDFEEKAKKKLDELRKRKVEEIKKIKEEEIKKRFDQSREERETKREVSLQEEKGKVLQEQEDPKGETELQKQEEGLKNQEESRGKNEQKD